MGNDFGSGTGGGDVGWEPAHVAPPGGGWVREPWPGELPPPTGDVADLFRATTARIAAARSRLAPGWGDRAFELLKRVARHDAFGQLDPDLREEVVALISEAPQFDTS